jgi:hypothetical protein
MEFTDVFLQTMSLQHFNYCIRSTRIVFCVRFGLLYLSLIMLLMVSSMTNNTYMTFFKSSVAMHLTYE